MDRVTCRCGWSVYVGMDCDFCGIHREDVLEHARAAQAVSEIAELRLV